jgi:plasmid stabilization system protein ParE
MNHRIIFRRKASRDLKNAFDWYEEQSEGLGVEFLRAVNACVAGIVRNPHAFPIIYDAFRRALLRRFPYALFFTESRERIVVHACFHAKRDPAGWRELN